MGWYFGKLCIEHPELEGKRNSRGACPPCQRKKLKIRNAIKADGGTEYSGKFCVRHPELNGKRRVYDSRCATCENDRLKEWAQNNPVKIKETKHRWCDSNRATIHHNKYLRKIAEIHRVPPWC